MLYSCKGCITGDCPVGLFCFKSVGRDKHGSSKLFLGLQGTPEPQKRLQMVDRDTAITLQLTAVPDHPNAVTMQVIPVTSRMYVSVPCNAPLVDLWHSQDGSGRQIWNGSKRTRISNGSIAWQLMVSGGHEHCDGRHSLSCSSVAHEDWVDLWHEPYWLIEPVH